MKIAVVGAGGVGGYFGARLAKAGCDVTFVARGAHLAAMRDKGLRILSEGGDIHLDSPKLVERPEQLSPVDLVIVAVKLWDTEQVAASLRSVAEQGAAVISFQNGVAKDEILAKHLPAESILGGSSFISAFIESPGVVRHVGALQRLVFGEYNGQRSARVEDFLDACQRAGINAEIHDDVRRQVWEKFVFLVGLSGATSAIRQTIGPVRENPRSRAFLHDLMRETVAVGRARGINLAENYADDRLAFCDTLPAGMTSSMHNDLERGNRLEVAWLSGGVADYGRELGVQTPRNQAVADILAIYAQGTRR
ncbi:ketopantoate reductase family protein [Uliginosibacterium sp. sgz301328]|uniref:ketopantoate reductase family protein n=1 Tax=Uliginosibacterium sp. sgz301328 TaxID=3243764 RepID=UPI00359D68DA